MSVNRYSVWEDEMFEEKHALNSTNVMVHLMVKHEDYAALESRCAALAAEMAWLKKFCKDAAFDADYKAELGMERGGFTDALNNIKTPSTDAYLAEVRAQGVEMAVDVVKQCYDNICAGGLQENREYEESIVQPHLDGIDDELKEIIAQLRKGVQS